MCELLQWLVKKPEVANAASAVASSLVSFFAFIVSVVSLYVAHTTLKHQRIHNVLSVSPLPLVAVGDYEDRLFVKLRNNGPGPLILLDLKVRGADMTTTESLVEWMPELPAGVDWSTFVGPLLRRSFASGSELTLLELVGNEHSETFSNARALVRQCLSHLTVEVAYTDIYGTVFAPYIKELSWFARTL